MQHGNSVVDLLASTESCTLSISDERTDYIAVFCTFGSTVKTGSGISRPVRLFFQPTAHTDEAYGVKVFWGFQIRIQILKKYGSISEVYSLQVYVQQTAAVENSIETAVTISS